MKNSMKKLTYGAMFCALCFVATYIKVRIPAGFGYVNLGDSIVLLCGWMLGPVYGFFSAAIGSALCDVVSEFVIYAPVTFLIKGAVATVAYFLFTLLNKKISSTVSRVVSGTVGEMIMVFGYFLFELVLYGFAVSAVDAVFNAVQGFVGLIIGVALARVLQRIPYFSFAEK